MATWRHLRDGTYGAGHLTAPDRLSAIRAARVQKIRPELYGDRLRERIEKPHNAKQKADRPQAAVHLDPEFEAAVERLATILARDDNGELEE